MDRDAVRPQQTDALRRHGGEDMNPIRGMLCAVSASATLAAAVATPAAETGPSAEAGWAAVTRCAQQDTERARHNCVDQVLRDAGLLTPEVRERQQRRAFGLEQPAAPPAAKAPPAPTAKESPATPAPESPPDRVEVQIASVAKSPDGKLIITTTEGAVWRQTESAENYRLPAAGEQMAIRRGSLGGYLCTPSSKLTWRCARSR
jgi:hypothetical protein